MSEPSRQPRPSGTGMPSAVAAAGDSARDEPSRPPLRCPSGAKSLVIRVVLHRGRRHEHVGLARWAAWLRSNHRVLLLIGGILVSASLLLFIAFSNLDESRAARPAAGVTPGVARAPSAASAEKAQPEPQFSAATQSKATETRGVARGSVPALQKGAQVPPAGQETPAAAPGATGPSPGSESVEALPDHSMRAVPPLPALTEQRALRRSVQLANFSWRPDAQRQTLMVDLTVRNQSTRAVNQIEVVCSQHAKDLTLLETSKMRVRGDLRPHSKRVFRSVAGGPLNRSTYRVHCLIADVSAAAVPAD